MDVACEKCQAKFKIPDEKVPKGQVFAVACPKCKNKISIDTRSEAPRAAAKPAGAPAAKSMAEDVSSSSYDAAEKPFDFLEEGVETALLCEQDPDVRMRIKEAAESMGYHVREAKSPIDALKQMRFHDFDLVVVNEMFGTDNPDENGILKSLERLPMSTRRNIFVALVTERFRTQDNMELFNKSVNMIVNRDNIDEFGKILKRSVAENSQFYRVFKEVLIKTGRT